MSARVQCFLLRFSLGTVQLLALFVWLPMQTTISVQKVHCFLCSTAAHQSAAGFKAELRLITTVLFQLMQTNKITLYLKKRRVIIVTPSRYLPLNQSHPMQGQPSKQQRLTIQLMIKHGQTVACFIAPLPHRCTHPHSRCTDPICRRQCNLTNPDYG